jgi:hypothetical protein
VIEHARALIRPGVGRSIPPTSSDNPGPKDHVVTLGHPPTATGPPAPTPAGRLAPSPGGCAALLVRPPTVRSLSREIVRLNPPSATACPRPRTAVRRIVSVRYGAGRPTAWLSAAVKRLTRQRRPHRPDLGARYERGRPGAGPSIQTSRIQTSRIKSGRPITNHRPERSGAEAGRNPIGIRCRRIKGHQSETLAGSMLAPRGIVP